MPNKIFIIPKILRIILSSVTICINNSIIARRL
jgi:hypothetical protein